MQIKISYYLLTTFIIEWSCGELFSSVFHWKTRESEPQRNSIMNVGHIAFLHSPCHFKTPLLKLAKNCTKLFSTLKPVAKTKISMELFTL